MRFQSVTWLVLSACAMAAPAADVTFTGTAGTNWSLAGSWSTGAVPGAGQSVDIPAGKSVVLNVDTPGLGAVSVAGTMTISGGKTLLAAALANSGAVALNGGGIKGAVISGGTITASLNNTLDGVTLTGGTTLDLSKSNGVTCTLNNAVTIDGTVLVGATNGATYAYVYWATAATTWSGSGSIVLGGNSNNRVLANAYNTGLTLGSGLTIRGTAGIIAGNYGSTGSFTNLGRITSDGGSTLNLNLWDWSNAGMLTATAGSTLSITSGGTWANSGAISGASGSTVTLTSSGTGSNTGTISTTGGVLSVDGSGSWSNRTANGVNATNGTLSLGGTWTNSSPGSLGAVNSTVNLGGKFSTTEALAVQRSGSTTVRLTGAMDNTKATLALGSGTGSWYLDGGTITGGTITGSAGARLICTSVNSTLDGVILATGTTLDLATLPNAQCSLNNTVTIDGTVQVGAADGTTYGYLYYTSPSTTWLGTGTIQLGGSTNNQVRAYASDTTLTLGSGLTIRATNGSLTAMYSNTGTLINNGRIIADNGTTLYLNLWAWTNNGTIAAVNGANLTLTSGGAWSNAGTISGDTGSMSLTNNGPGSNLGTLTTTGGTLAVEGTGSWSNRAANGVTVTDGILILGGTWSNSTPGTINAVNSTVNLGGNYSTTEALSVNHSGKTRINLTGVLDNSGATLALGANTGSWHLKGGTIRGGTISGTANEGLVCESATNVLDGVTIAAGTVLDVASFPSAQCYLENTVTIDGTVLVGATNGSNYGYLYWTKAATIWQGSGRIVLGSSANNRIQSYAYNAALTIGSNLTIAGTGGAIFANYGSTGSFTNHGTIRSEGGGTLNLNLWAWSNDGTMTATTGSSLILTSSSAWSNSGSINGATGSKVTLTNNGNGSNSGTISTNGGILEVAGTGTWTNTRADGVTASKGTLTLGGTWTSTGTGSMNATDSALNLGGTFTTPDALAVQHGGTTVTLTGVLNNAGGTLTLGPATGSWQLNGGTIRGGTVVGTANERLICKSANNRLDGVTLAAGTVLDLSTIQYAQCYLDNTVTIDGTVLLGESDGSTYGYLYWTTTDTTLTGSGTIRLGASINNQIRAYAYNTNLTIGSGLTISGLGGQVYANYGNTGTFLNQGTIRAETGGSLALNLWAWTNNGNLTAQPGADLTLTSGGAWNNAGTISGGPGSSIILTNNGAGGNSGTITTTEGELTVAGTGTWSNTKPNGISANSGTLTLGGTWSNGGTGSMAATGSTIKLGGTFTTAQALAIQQIATKSVEITGNLDNSGGTLNLGPATGSWYLNGGTITGGTIQGTANERLIARNAVNTLDGVTLANGTTLDLTTNASAQCTLNNTMTINGTVLVGATDGSTYGNLYWSTNATWGGNGSIQLGATSNNALRANNYNLTLTIGSSLVIDALKGQIVGNYGATGSIVNYGTIRSSGAGPLTINAPNFTNHGTLNVSLGSKQTWTWNGNFTQSATGSIVFEIGGTAASQADLLSFSGTSTVVLNGTVRILSTGGFVPDAATNVAIVSLVGGSVSGSATVPNGYVLSYVGTKVFAVGLAGLNAPTVTLTSPTGDPVLAGPIPMSVNFNIPVSGFSASSLSTVNASVANFAGAGSSYSFDLVPSVAQGTVSVSVPAGVAISAGELSNAASTTFTRLFNSVDPVITYVSPATGTTAGGNVVVISGTGFMPASTQVSIAGVQATVTGTTPIKITCTTPPGSAGAAAVAVTVAGRSATLNRGYTYATPQIPDVVFNGSLNANWATAANWTPAAVPTAGQRVDIPAGKSCTLNATTAALGAVTVEGTLVLGSGFTFQATSLTNNGVVKLSGTTVKVPSINGSALIATNATNVLDGVVLDVDLDLTQVSGAQVTISNTVTLGGGHVINLGASDGSTYGYLNFVGGTGGNATLAASSSATIVLGSSSNNLIRDLANGTQMTLGSEVTVMGGAGSIYASYTGSKLIIAGSVEATTPAKVLTIGNSTIPTLISGSVKADGGILTLAGSWDCSGELRIRNDSTVNLGGSFSQTSVADARWNRRGGTVNLTGNLLLGGTLTHTLAMGPWILKGASITGGTLASTGGTLIATSATSTLDGVFLDADLDLAQTSGSQVTITNSVQLGNGRKIFVGAADGTTYGYLSFTGGVGGIATLSASGTASVVLGTSTSNLIRDVSNGTVVTLGSGITVSGGAASIYATYASSSLTIAGSVEATTPGKAINLGYSNYPVAISGTVRASGGDLHLIGTWSNTGLIDLSAGTVVLDGTFNAASVQDARWKRTGGNVDLSGDLTIGAGNTLIHSAAMGTWRLAGCTVTGGTWQSTGGTLVATNAANILDGLVLNADLDLTTVSGAQATIRNTVTLTSGRTIRVGAQAGGTYGYLNFTPGSGNVATLTSDGTATVLLGGSTNNLLRDNTASTAMTIGNGIIVKGGSGSIYAYYGGSTLTIAGTVEAATPGNTVILGYDSYPLAITGSIRATGGTLTVNGIWTNSGRIDLTTTGTVNLDGQFSAADVQDARWSRSGGTVNLTGTLTIGTGNVLTQTPAMGDWQLAGGTIVGGSWLSTGPKLIGLNSTNTLDGLTLDVDLDLSQISSAQATITNTVTLGNGRTIALGNAGGSTYGYLYFSGGAGNVASLGANVKGSVILGGSTNNTLRDYIGSTAMTLGTGLTVSGASGAIYAYNSGSNLTIAGTVEATVPGGTVTVGYGSTSSTSIAGGGVVRATGGELALAGRWANAGTLGLSAGTLDLGGEFSADSVQDTRWSRTGGSMILSGKLSINAGTTLTHTLAMGVWHLHGSTIRGGTLTSTGGTLVADYAVNTFDGVRLDADLDLTQVNGAEAVITNTVTLGQGRTIAVGSPSGSTYGYLYFTAGLTGNATLDSVGTAKVMFGKSTNNLIADNANNTAITLGSGITVKGGAGVIYAYYAGSTLTIAGQVEAGTPAKIMTIGYNAQPSSLTGTVTANQGIIALTGNWTNSGTLATQSGTIKLGGSFPAASVTGTRWSRSAGDAVVLTGDLTIGTGNTLALDAQTGSWQISGGSLIGGTLSDPDSRLVFTSTLGTLDGVTIPVGTVIDLGLVNGASCSLDNAVTIDGSIRVGRTDGGTYGRLYWSSATATWGGTGDIVFGGNNSNSWFAQSGAGALTIAAPLQVHGQQITINATTSGSSITNYGTLATDVTGGDLQVNVTTFNNHGTIVVGRDSPQTWNCTGGFTQGADGVLELEIGGPNTGQADRLAFTGTATVNLGGTVRVISSSGYVPNAATSVDLITLTGGSLTGAFTTIQGAYALSYTGTKVTALGTSGLTAPTVLLTSSATDPVTSGPIPMLATFSAPVTDFAASDILANGATVGGLLPVDAATYTFTLTPTLAQGLIRVGVPAGGALNAQLISNTASALKTILYNGVDPTIAVNGISPAVGTTAGETLVTILGTNFLAGSTSVTFGGAAATVQTVTPTSITCTTPAGSGTVPVTITVAGRSVTANNAYTYSNVLPGMQTQIPTSEYQALTSWFTATGGAAWTGSTGWNDGAANLWQGVSVAGGHVTGLSMANNNLSGNLSPVIANLPFLQVLDLGGNRLTGEIPAAITFLASLTSLNLSQNNFVGQVPDGLTALTNLTLSTGLRLEGNGLYTSGNPTVNSFLMSRQPTWAATQTVAPDGFQATLVDENVLLTWTPIAYTADGGQYEIGYNLDGSTAYVFDAGNQTISKSEGQILVTGLARSTTYYFTVRTRTPAHNGQVNTVLSDPAAQVTVTTPAPSGPSVFLATLANDPAISGPIPVTVTFNEPVTGFTLDGLMLENATAQNLQQNGLVYSFELVPSVLQAQLKVEFPAGTITSVATGLGNTTASPLTLFYNGIDPLITGLIPATGPDSGGTTVVLSGENFLTNWTDVIIGGQYATIQSLSATSITLITPPGTGMADVEVHVAGRSATSLSAFTYQTTVVPPTVNLQSSSSDPALGGPIPLTIVFSAPVTGFTVDDLVLTGATAANFAGGGASYTVDLMPTVTQGEISVEVPAAVALDDRNVGNLAALRFSIFFNGVDPLVTGIAPTSGPETGGTSVLLSGANFLEGRTTVTIGGLSATVTSVTASTISFLSPPGLGTKDVVVEVAGRSATSVGAFTYQPIVAGPTVVLSSSVTSPALAGPIPLSITFSAPVTGFTVDDLVLGSATAANFAGSGTSYTVDLQPTLGQGTISVDLPANAAMNAQGTGNQAALRFSILYNGIDPVISSVLPASGGIEGGTTVALVGSGFLAGQTSVTFGGVPATILTVGDSALAVTTPPGNLGPVTVVVTCAGRSVSLPNGFTYAATSVGFTTESLFLPEGAGVVAGTTGGVLTVRLAATSVLPVSVPFMVTTVTGTGNATIATPSPLVFAPGVLSQNILISAPVDGPNGPGGTAQDTVLAVTLGTPVNAALGAKALATLTLVDGETFAVTAQLGAGPTLPVPGGQGLALDATVGQTLNLALVNGTPPYVVVPGTGNHLITVPWQFTPSAKANGTLDPAQDAQVVVRSPGKNTVTVSDSTGSTVTVTVTAAALPVIRVAAPSVTMSSNASTVYGAICPGTAEGLGRLLGALSNRAANSARAFWWNATVQEFREITAGETTGLTPTSAVFLATRVDLGLDFSGTPQPFYQELTLAPGWSFVGLPPLSDGQTPTTSHTWNTLFLYDDAGNRIKGPQRDALIGTGGYSYDGKDYKVETILVSGKGYWIKNNSSPGQVLRLVRVPDPVAAIDQSLADRVSSKAAVPGTQVYGVVDRGSPPAPPSATTSQADSSSGGGCGSGSSAGFVVALLALWLRRRRAA